MTETYQCIGCGATIQTTAPDQPGYLPASALAKGIETGEFYCQRCFRLRHYNELQDLQIDEDVFLDRLHQVADEDAYVIHVIDLFDVEGTTLHQLPRLINHQDYAVVANKVDLLPKSVKLNRIRHWLTERLATDHLRPEEVILLSGRKTASLDPLLAIIEREIPRRNVYLVGVTNVGKSTLINQLIKHFGGEANIITTSNFPGTTLDLIEIPLTKETAIIDTPGIIRPQQAIHLLSRQSMQTLLPTKPIKPRTFQLNPEQSIFFGGMGWVDFTAGERTAWTFYVNNDLYLHRTKLEKSADFYDKHVGELLAPPTPDEYADFPQMEAHQLSLDAGLDLAISGIGWVTVNRPVQLTLHLPAGVLYTVRPSMI